MRRTKVLRDVPVAFRESQNRFSGYSCDWTDESGAPAESPEGDPSTEEVA